MKWTVKKTFYWSLGRACGLVLSFYCWFQSLLAAQINRAPKEVHIFRLQAGPPAPKLATVTPPQKKSDTAKEGNNTTSAQT